MVKSSEAVAAWRLLEEKAMERTLAEWLKVFRRWMPPCFFRVLSLLISF